MAARMEDIVEVHSWQKPIMVPSDTPWVTGMVRLEQECLPVYDLAAKLQRAIDESAALCLVVKHEDGPMAVCIDATIPSLHMVNIQNMRPVDHGDHDLLGRCMVAGQEVTVLRAAQLGKIPSDAMASRRQRSG
jgi:chemotaxis signal transduction protein